MAHAEGTPVESSQGLGFGLGLGLGLGVGLGVGGTAAERRAAVSVQGP